MQASVTGTAIMMLCLGVIKGNSQSISVERKQHHSLHCEYCEPGLHSMMPSACGATKNSFEDMEQIDDIEFLSSAGACDRKLNIQVTYKSICDVLQGYSSDPDWALYNRGIRKSAGLVLKTVCSQADSFSPGGESAGDRSS